MKAHADVMYCPQEKSIAEAVPAFRLILTDDGRLEFHNSIDAVAPISAKVAIETAHAQPLDRLEDLPMPGGGTMRTHVRLDPGTIEHFAAFIDTELGANYCVLTPLHGS